ncbi:hypothetical protein FJQ98_15490 [Lysinibacillus agricola]|uniref:Uncharacterized protein n=1 Tax=Lysinibacillus agricola TaxID=2590012 RepID=A0ABX7AMF8_9BACI|nr:MULTISPECIES: hypothetical protein [Lysinibacillus]QQP10661.1 hypothetical protein FJQ98_15490 [Lysinibacillus agricola]
MNILTTEQPYIESITIGHGRDLASTIAARELARLWEVKGGFQKEEVLDYGHLREYVEF